MDLYKAMSLGHVGRTYNGDTRSRTQTPSKNKPLELESIVTSSKGPFLSIPMFSMSDCMTCSTGGWFSPSPENSTSDGFLVSIVTPILLPFLAWGFLNAFVSSSGWTPNADLAALVAPGLNILLPTLIAFSSGYLIYCLRGGLLAATVAVGVMSAATVPMLVASLLFSVFVALVLRWGDYFFNGLLTDRFPVVKGTVGAIWFIALAVTGSFLAHVMFEPIVTNSIESLGNAATELEKAWLPLVSMMVEPAKVLFLDSGITFTPECGSGNSSTCTSQYYTLQTSVGPGSGVLLALVFLTTDAIKSTLLLSFVLLFFGGVHPIYFPYVYMYPQTLIALVLGGVTHIGVYQGLGFGLTAAPSPASIMGLTDVTPDGKVGELWLGILLSALVSFLGTFLVLAPNKFLEYIKCQPCLTLLKRCM